MLILNNLPDYQTEIDRSDLAMVGKAGAIEAKLFPLPGSNLASPLHHLPALAASLGLGNILVKDESCRLGLGSFKALGGAYAVIRIALKKAKIDTYEPITETTLNDPHLRLATAEMTFACATDGNHGKSVAWGAQLIGAKCCIFVHEGVSQSRADAIAAYGAEIIRVSGSYDDSVEEARRVAELEGWTVVSDTSWPGYERIPGLVMQGYTHMLDETLAQLDTVPTHVFIQAGVGGVAAAVAGYLADHLGKQRPKIIIVEPKRAACLFESVKAGKSIRISQDESTIMAMLECYEPSLVAWRILSRIADGFVVIDDKEAIHAVRRLAYPLSDDPVIVSGESGAAGLGGLICIMNSQELRDMIGLSSEACVLVFNTEGATDPELYQKIIGSN